ncbi:MAG: hypothetical protein ABIY51_13290 [Ferruginibacter sp.]
MKTSIAFLSVAFIAFVTILLLKKRNEEGQEMFNQVADEGYETAHDILYPGKRHSSRHLRYGPVLPRSRY